MTVDKSRYPLPEGAVDGVLNRQGLAKALETSVNTIDRWREDGMPVAREGTNGQSYEFQLSDCWAWKCAREQAERDKAAENEDVIRKMRLALTGGSSGDSEMSLSPKARRELYAAENEYLEMCRRKGELIPQQDVFDLLDHILSSVRRAVTGLPDRLSRDAGLTGRQTEQAVAASDDLLRELHQTLEERVADFGAAPETAATTLDAFA
ncbi:MAG: DUF1441 family protein [Roseibium sp.]|nr:DUF1441 family protein [Roseibium sp.]